MKVEDEYECLITAYNEYEYDMNDDCCAAAETQSDVYGASKRVFSVVIIKL